MLTPTKTTRKAVAFRWFAKVATTRRGLKASGYARALLFYLKLTGAGLRAMFENVKTFYED